MRVVAVTMVRDEADIIEATIRHTVAEGADHVIVADNLSTDDTRVILDKLAGELPVTVVDDWDPAYEQAAKMTDLARMAADEHGADWVWPFDADEFFHAPETDQRVSDVLSATTADVVLASGWDHVVRPGEHGAPMGPAPWRRAEPQRLGKVLFRPKPGSKLEMGNHSVSPAGNVARGVLHYCHQQYRRAQPPDPPWAQMARKLRTGAAAYAASDVHMKHGTHWREGGQLTDEQMAAKWDELTNEAGLVWDPAPVSGRTASVVIPTRDRADLLAGCVRSVEEHSPDAEIIVAEGDASFGENSNRGALRATGDVLVFLNDDAVVRPGWLEPLTRRVGWGLVGANLINPDGTDQHTGVYFRRRNDILEAYNSDDARPAGEVPAVTGACLAIGADLFAELDGFDVGFVNGYEDVDLALRARRAGWRCFYEPDSVIEHSLSQSAGRFDRAVENIERLNDRWGALPV